MCYSDTSYEIDFKMCKFQIEMCKITLIRKMRTVIKYIHSHIQIFYQTTLIKGLLCIGYRLY
jgi:hypothetical protein